MNEDDGWNEHDGYMNAKISKLNKQFNEGVRNVKSDIFNGISIFINGFTEPSDYILKNLMQDHGGKFQHYYSKDNVTHIIANVLPKGKIDKLTDQRIVTPKWITDSLEAGVLLDWTDYQLYSERHNSNQKMMKQFLNQPLTIDNSISLNEYYQKSRLHHLSTWATQLNDYLNELKEKNNDLNFSDRNSFTKNNESCILTKNISESLIMHIDMDCFFVSVGLKRFPELKGSPVAVAHSSGKFKENDSMSEIASCSYEARKYGIKNGMILGKAQKLCPQLKTIPYTFEDYLQVAKSLYRIVSKYTHEIEVGSCDELYLKLDEIIKVHDEHIIDPKLFAEHIRTEIYNETQCTASCGISTNILGAKLATSCAKPNGVCWLSSQNELMDVIQSKSVRILPGVGRVIEDKLKQINVVTCGELQKIDLNLLKSKFGSKIGLRLYDNCRGKDSRSLQIDKERKSISAEINYGIRMDDMNQLKSFIEKLATELSNRMKDASVTGEFLLVKFMIRHPDAEKESIKYLGHGICENFSKSSKLSKTTDDPLKIADVALQLFHQMKKPICDLRGIGLTMQKLNSSKSCIPKTTIGDYFQKKQVTNQNEGSFTKNNKWLENINNLNDEEVVLLSSDEDLSGEQEIDESNNNEEYIRPIGDLEILPSTSSNKSNITLSKPKPKTTNIKRTKGQLTIDQMINRISKPKSSSSNNQNNVEVILRSEQNEKSDNILDDIVMDLGNTDMDKFYDALLEWIKNEKEPLEEDATLIGRQLIRMVTQGRLSDLNDILLFMYRKIKKYHYETNVTLGVDISSANWRVCLRVFIESIQQRCLEEFGAKLEINSEIDY